MPRKAADCLQCLLDCLWRSRDCPKWPWECLKGTVSRDFLLLVSFMNQFPPSPWVYYWGRFKFFRKFAEIFADQGWPPVSTTPVANWPPVSTTPAANFATSFTSVVDTGGKFATGVNNAGGKLPPVSTTSAANLPLVSKTPVANNGNNIRLQIPQSELEGKNLYICQVYYPKVSQQNH